MKNTSFINYGFDPRFGLKLKGEEVTYLKEPIIDTKSGDPAKIHRKISIKPNLKKSVVFVTYGGMKFGQKEAVPNMQILSLEIKHLKFECIGQFCCPGKYLNDTTPWVYHGDIRKRTNKRDLLKAEIFVEEILEKIAR
jgi:hypothetical protein